MYDNTPIDELLTQFGITGRSPEIIRLFSLAKQVSKTDAAILISGESGTGKELLARWIHSQSHRATKPYLAINCGAISQSLLESELFGHEKGAFTGANQLRKGHFESVNGGTLFLDEIGEMPLEIQVKLLRVLESGEFQRVGASQTHKTDCRILAATNRHLETEILQRRFRADLYYRLRTVELHIPPLRERNEDILPLAEKFISEFEKKYSLRFSGFTSSATELLLSYSFPGNVRELRHLLESLIVTQTEGKVTSELLSHYLQPGLHRALSQSEPLSTATKLLSASSAISKGKSEDLIPFSPQRHSAGSVIATPDPRHDDIILRALLQVQTEVSEVKALLQTVLASLPSRGSSTDQDNAHQDTINNATSPHTKLLPPSASLPSNRDEDTHAPNGLKALLIDFFETAKKDNRIPTLEEVERYAILETLKIHGGNKRKTAEVLGITERTLYRKLNHYKLDS